MYLSKLHDDLVAVLIDTWWNVNSGFSSDASTVILVLIDTWWNVNNSEESFEPI